MRRIWTGRGKWWRCGVDLAKGVGRFSGPSKGVGAVYSASVG